MDSASPDFLSVTELAGASITREQLERVYHRYYWAGTFCRGKDVVEVACGAGVALGFLARISKSFVAGDYSEKLVELARRHYGNRVEVSCFDAQALPFPDQSKDVILLFEALYYLPNPECFISECRRVLRPGGHVLLVTANKDLYDFNPSPFSRRYLGVRELEELLSSHGFTTEFFGNSPITSASPWQRLLRPVKKVAVSLKIVPKTMRGKELLKRIVFGKLVSLPPEIDEDEKTYEPPPAISSRQPDFKYKVVYCGAQAP